MANRTGSTKKQEIDRTPPTTHLFHKGPPNANFDPKSASSGSAIIDHLGYHCPGLHGPGCKQRIEPMSMARLFDEVD